MEHAATMLVGILIASAFMRYGASSKKFQRGFLAISVSLTLIIYLLTAIGWPGFLLLHPKTSFAPYWGELAFRLTGTLVLGTALVVFTMDRLRGSRVPFPLMAGITFLFLDELLMICNIATAEQYVAYFAPVRHNLHIWAIPFFIATYWSDLKYKSKLYEDELEKQQRRLAEVNLSLEKRMADAVGELERRDWFNSGLNELNSLVRGDKKLQEMADTTLAFLIRYIGAAVGVFYTADAEDGSLTVISTFAIIGPSRINTRIAPGEGLAGQVATNHSTIKLSPVPPHYLPIGSALGEATPMEIIVLPVLHDGQLAAVLELGSFKPLREDDTKFLEQSAEAIGVTMGVNLSNKMLNDLLEKTRTQSKRLQMQQEELQQTNEELEERARMLAERQISPKSL